MSTETREVVWIAGALAAALLLMMLSGSTAFAIPHVYVSDSGNDANDGSNQFPVQTGAGITRLCAVNGVIPDNCDTGLKWGKDDTPTMVSVEFLDRFTKHKADKTETHSTTEIVSGHGQRPEVDEIKSLGNGWGLRRKYVWSTRSNVNGPQEYVSDVQDSIFVD